jgi:hypothetical protein
MHFVWRNTGVRFSGYIPDKFKIPVSAVLVIIVLLIGALSGPESQGNIRGNRAVSLFGLVVTIIFYRIVIYPIILYDILVNGLRMPGSGKQYSPDLLELTVGASRALELFATLALCHNQ